MCKLQDRRVQRLFIRTSPDRRNFDNQEQEIKANHLIFILSGEVEITKDENEKARVHANEFVFIPISSHYVGKVILPGRYINLTFSITTFPYVINTC